MKTLEDRNLKQVNLMFLPPFYVNNFPGHIRIEVSDKVINKLYSQVRNQINSRFYESIKK